MNLTADVAFEAVHQSFADVFPRLLHVEPFASEWASAVYWQMTGQTHANPQQRRWATSFLHMNRHAMDRADDDGRHAGDPVFVMPPLPDRVRAAMLHRQHFDVRLLSVFRGLGYSGVTVRDPFDDAGFIGLDLAGPGVPDMLFSEDTGTDHATMLLRHRNGVEALRHASWQGFDDVYLDAIRHGVTDLQAYDRGLSRA